ncbi:MAG: hypothetical protein DRO62_00395 [Candidatus Altiarchaeales archaeon]|nr:MAG: hypothetical protein DRO62_00395 [Candidatus Altiarchaeales archaeon]
MKSKTFMLLLIILSNTAVGAHILPIGLRETTIQDIITVFYGITAATGVVMIIFHGIKWITADNDEDRKQAREGVIHVLLGLLFILIAAALVDMVYRRPSY